MIASGYPPLEGAVIDHQPGCAFDGLCPQREQL